MTSKLCRITEESKGFAFQGKFQRVVSLEKVEAGQTQYGNGKRPGVLVKAQYEIVTLTLPQGPD